MDHHPPSAMAFADIGVKRKSERPPLRELKTEPYLRPTQCTNSNRLSTQYDFTKNERRHILSLTQPTENEIKIAEMQDWNSFCLQARNHANGRLRPDFGITSAVALCSVQGLGILASNRVLGAGVEGPVQKHVAACLWYCKKRSGPRFFPLIAPASLKRSCTANLKCSVRI
jgi:hypothetical protein